MAGLIKRSVWDKKVCDPRLWEGFRKVVTNPSRLYVPHALPVVLSLPPTQLGEVLEHADGQRILPLVKQYVAKNRAAVSAKVLEVVNRFN